MTIPGVAAPDGPSTDAGALWDAPWAHPGSAHLTALGVERERGLTADEVRRRLAEHGPNQLRRIERRGAWRVLLDQFSSLLVALLAAAAVVAVAFGEHVEATAIGVVLLLNAVIGFFTELRALESMDALRQLGMVRARVRRDGHLMEVDATQLVPGDILTVEGGDVITADVRLLEASRLQANESALTGESVPVGKRTASVAAGATIGDRDCMLYKGTSVTRGAGEGVVVATGMNTEIGRISRLVEQAGDETTPLEKRLNKLGQGLVAVTLVMAVLVGFAGFARGKALFLIVETAIALAVATVPEGLPVIATIALARGMQRMARRNVLINRLSAVETLGATNVIFSDKTGTLTENRMTVEQVSSAAARVALELGALCNNASLHAGEAGVGDPLEVALLAAADAAGVDRAALRARYPELREVAFDPESKMMATVHRDGARVMIAVKGAPEAVLDASASALGASGSHPLDDAERRRWRDDNERLAGDGLRVLAIARRCCDAEPSQVYRELELVALVGLLDPPRADVAAAIGQCRAAGVQVVMVTGDHALTARVIARAVGIDPVEVHARVSPEGKLNLIDEYQRAGHTVAMTGDGVNDAPALKKADIGVAMGQRGTAVAREASDMILKDDAFSSIVAAIAEGRVIFDNIRSFVVYLLSCNLSELFVIGLATAVGAPLPLLPLQILFLNLVTDVFPALALGLGEGDASVMQRPPRPRSEDILTRRLWARIGVYGVLLTASVLGAFAIALNRRHGGASEAVTVAFLTLAFGQLWHVFNMRSDASPWLHNEITRNRAIWGAIALCTVLLLLAVYAPGLADVLGLTRPGVEGWGLALGFSAIPLVATLPFVRRLLP